MTSPQLTQTVLSLPVEERVELARKIVASLVVGHGGTDAMAEGIRRIEEIGSGKINGLTEQQFREALR